MSYDATLWACAHPDCAGWGTWSWVAANRHEDAYPTHAIYIDDDLEWDE